MSVIRRLFDCGCGS